MIPNEKWNHLTRQMVEKTWKCMFVCVREKKMAQRKRRCMKYDEMPLAAAPIIQRIRHEM